MEVKNIPIERIKTSPLNPRKTFDETELRELADNIKKQGLLQPITVRPIEPNEVDPVGGNFEIVCGERRFRAWYMNAVDPKYPKQIPCIVQPMSDSQALDAMITENLQRKDVDPIEEAFAFGQLHAHGKSVMYLSERFGKSKRFIVERIKLDALIPELKKLVTDGVMHIGAALHICKLDEDKQKDFHERYKHYDEIPKSAAERYTGMLFMRLEDADWDKDFAGPCGHVCGQCPFNNANAGCLFYEMKIGEDKACCTNRENFERKLAAWKMHLIDREAKTLVKEGEALEKGKTVVAYSAVSYAMPATLKKLETFLKEIRAKGFKVVKLDEIFDSYSSYDEDDERLKEKLEKGELYRVVRIVCDYYNYGVDVRYYTFSKEPEGESAEDAEAMKLAVAYGENIRKYKIAKAEKLAEVVKTKKPEELSKAPLDAEESRILYALLLGQTSAEYRKGVGINVYGNDAEVFHFANTHTELAHQAAREYIRYTLSQSGVAYYADKQACQADIIDHWYKEEGEKAVTELYDKYIAKQKKIEERLTALGYDTEGKKLKS